jgi:hypothetical protein
MTTNAKAIFQSLAAVLNKPRALLEYWNDNPKHHHRFQELTDASDMLASVDIAPDMFADALEDWLTNDWRGKQGTMPSPIQFAEHCIDWKGRAEKQAQTLRALDAPRPRWQGQYDVLRSKYVAYEAKYASTTNKDWLELARAFDNAGRPTASARCKHKTVSTDTINYLAYES